MSIPPLTQLQAFADWEKKNRPDPAGRKHVAQWAVEEIERLSKEVELLREEMRTMRPDLGFYDDDFK